MLKVEVEVSIAYSRAWPPKARGGPGVESRQSGIPEWLRPGHGTLQIQALVCEHCESGKLMLGA